MEDLTDRGCLALQAIEDSYDRLGIAPSVAEVARAVGCAQQTALTALRELERKGRIRLVRDEAGSRVLTRGILLVATDGPQ